VYVCVCVIVFQFFIDLCFAAIERDQCESVSGTPATPG